MYLNYDNLVHTKFCYFMHTLDETTGHIADIEAIKFDFNEAKIIEECANICNLAGPSLKEFFGVRKVFRRSYKCKCLGSRLDNVVGKF